MLLARYVFRDAFRIKAKKYKLFMAFDKTVKYNGLKILILLRLCPMTPFNLTNYMLGATSLSPWTMFLGNFAMIPTTSIYCYTFTTIESVVDMRIEDDSSTEDFMKLERILLVLGGILGLFLIYYITQLVKS
jgi:uncharacterized membrane protein YdjX (TVP38/TMEM64 family)